MPKYNIERNMRHGEILELESNMILDLKEIQIVRMHPGWTQPIELRYCVYVGGAEAEELSSSFWSTKRLEPHITSVDLRAEGSCKIKAEGAYMILFANLLFKRSEGGKRTDPDDDSCVLL